MRTDHSSKDGNDVPVQRHRLDCGVDEQQEYFTEDRRRSAQPRKITRPGPSEDAQDSTGEK